MGEFKHFKQKVEEQFSLMTLEKLFEVDVSKDELWDMYLKSFPAGTNEIFKERTEHDCQCCKQFIRACGNVVSITPNLELRSIWDVQLNEENQHYQVVANALSALVKHGAITNEFIHYQKKLGTDFNHQENEDGPIKKWEHFYFNLPDKFVKHATDIGAYLSNSFANAHVFRRGLETISMSAIDTVLELIDQDSIYRGEEHKEAILSFSALKMEVSENIDTEGELNKYSWLNSHKQGARIRNTAIGTLLIDISEGGGLDKALGLFESKVAPQNYKRPKAVVTKSMLRNAQKTIYDLGIGDSLGRRHAKINDVTINNVLFANRATAATFDGLSAVFDDLVKDTEVNIQSLRRIEEVSIEDFIENILPKSKSIELILEDRHVGNFMSLISPHDKNAPSIFKWGNNFSWTYNGDVADSMKQRVKKAGGNIEGVLRFSIQWNDGDNNQNDFDAHCIEPYGNKIYYRYKTNRTTTGSLDVDIIHPGSKVAVENITWLQKNRMQEGKYKFLVHNYSHTGGTTGFTAEIEYDGTIYSYEYAKELRHNEKVMVAELEFDRNKGIKFINSLESTHSQKEMWGIKTNSFQNVSMIMNSPNHWDGEKTGNKHYFFILQDCKQAGKVRGFYNEFLKEDLTEHRKVFEILGGKLKAEESDEQLSGVGFSSTQRNSVFCKVTGSFSRTIKINF